MFMTRFLGEEKLLAQNAHFAKPGMQRLTDRVHNYISRSGSNITIIEGKESCLLVDSLPSIEEAQEALEEIQKITLKPIKTLIYTHTHPDHMGGAGILAKDANEIIARKMTVNTYGKSDLIQEISMKRGGMQWGAGLTPEEAINQGVGPLSVTHSKPAFLMPNRFITEEKLELTIDGIEILLIAADGETDDQTYIWLPNDKVLCCGDNYYEGFPNIYPIRGGQYRNVSAWVESLNIILSLAPEYLVPGHGRALIGQELIQEKITAYRDGVQFVLEETLKAMNRGLTPEQIIEHVQLPEHFKELPQLQEFYGKISWSIRSIFSGYLGWFDGNPTNLGFMPVKARAQKQLALAGGADHVLKAIQVALDNQDEQWAAELCDILINAEECVAEAKALKAKALTILARLDSNACARHYYLCCAKELEKEIK